MTQSRSGWVGVAGGLFVLAAVSAWLMPPSPKRRASLVALALFLLLGIGLAVTAGPQRISQAWFDPAPRLAATAFGSLRTINFRQELWPVAITALTDFPFSGAGLGTFRHVAIRLYPLSLPPEFDVGHAHNVFLQVALDVGLPGLIAYLALTLLAVSICWTAAVRDRALRPIGLGLLAGLGAFHLYGLADALAMGSKPALLIWVLMGITTALARTAGGQVRAA
jgi:putative inorganic carbon (HCO3(-)) transporter